MRKKIVVIGGGTGSVAVLTGLKKYSDLDISVIVSMTDDGGSNAVVRDEFGLLPLSDIRKSIIALSELEDDVLRQIFTYRFSKGDGLKGHTLGNLIMMGLSEITGSELGAIETVSKMFQLKGTVIPVTLEQAKLVARYDDGRVVKSEHLIDEPIENPDSRILELSLEPQVKGFERAIQAIEEAEMIIAGPGDLYTTTIANIVVDGIAQAIQKNKGQFVFISNLMTKKGQTHGMSASDLVGEITRYAGRTPDTVLIHAGELPSDVVKMYEEKNEFPIHDDISQVEFSVIRQNFLFDSVVEKDSGDTLVRSLIRHDANKLAHVLYSLIHSYELAGTRAA